jgi:signal transduction histidine kinase/ActR/RegA family two-component response regulator
MERERPHNEDARLEALQQYGILDTLPEEPFNDLARLAAIVCDTRAGFIGFLDSDRLCLKAKVRLSTTEVARSSAPLANHALISESLLVVEDARADERFSSDVFVSDMPHARFYAGAPLLTQGGHILGVLAVMDHAPRTLTTEQREALRALASLVMSQLERRRSAAYFSTVSDQLINEISRRRQAEEALRECEEQFRQAQKMEAVGRLAAGVAHDFNNLLVAILGQSDLLLKQLGEDEPVRRRVQEIRKAGEWAAALTRQLLAFSRKRILKPEVIEPDRVVAAMEPILKRLIGEDVELFTSLQASGGLIETDPGQIEQVVMNLVINARDAMPSGGKLTIETRNVSIDERSTKTHQGTRPGHYVMLSVSDTGCGMDEETKRRVFEPFFTTKEPEHGTGLGLSTVYGIVKQVAGSIWVSSEVGKGTTFTLYLPRVVRMEERDLRRSESARGTEIILVVEDEQMVRETILEMLATHGYGVIEARTGAEALQVSERHEGEIDLLITDVVMPGLSGREVAEKFLQASRQTKVLYISGYTENAIVHHGVLTSGTPFLQKPFTADSLLRKIREVFDGS